MVRVAIACRMMWRAIYRAGVKDSPVPSGRGLLFLPHVFIGSNMGRDKTRAESRPQHGRIAPPSASCLDNAA